MVSIADEWFCGDLRGSAERQVQPHASRAHGLGEQPRLSRAPDRERKLGLDYQHLGRRVGNTVAVASGYSREPSVLASGDVVARLLLSVWAA